MSNEERYQLITYNAELVVRWSTGDHVPVPLKSLSAYLIERAKRIIELVGELEEEE